jgi:DNA-binding IclR family transcriptional regulator
MGIVRNLHSRGNAKPRKLATRSSTISALFQKSLHASELQKLIEALQQEGYITLDGEAVTYHLSCA